MIQRTNVNEEEKRAKEYSSIKKLGEEEELIRESENEQPIMWKKYKKYVGN